MTERLLRLRAEAADDIPPLSALVQDMAIKAGDVHWDAKARRLTLIGNRYRHEATHGGTPSRIRALLRLDFLTRLQRREWPDEPHMVLPLLALVAEDDHVELIFGGGSRLRAATECIDMTLEDLGGPWGAQAVPDHGG